jgi:hypothetical protein
MVDAYVLPQYVDHAGPLLDAVLAQRDAMKVRFVYAVSCDRAKSELFAAAGMRRATTLPEHYRIDDLLIDLELWIA